MIIEKTNARAALIEFNIDELVVLANALNEVRNGIEVIDFTTRLGATRASVDELQTQLLAVLDQMSLATNESCAS